MSERESHDVAAFISDRLDLLGCASSAEDAQEDVGHAIGTATDEPRQETQEPAE